MASRPWVVAVMGVALLGSAWTRQGARQQQLPQFVAGSAEVDVPLIALNRRNQPLHNLPATAFSLSDDNQPQRLLRVDADPRPLTLAIVVDTGDLNAIAQANRSAELIAAMVVGDEGEAGIFVAGSEPRQILEFTSDHDQLTHVLHHLQPGPQAALGQGKITEPLLLAVLELKKRPSSRTRAVLVITKSNARNGDFAQALVESAASDAIPIFQVVPRRPAGGTPEAPNPYSPAQRGEGAGSNRDAHTISPVGTGGGVTETLPAASGDGANVSVNPATAIAAATSIFRPHNLDYDYDSGGMRYTPGNDGDFDRTLSLLGEELRAIHHLYYTPDNLTSAPELHTISVTVKWEAEPIGALTYRRSYLGIRPH